MNPFETGQWLLAAELAALVGEAARWDWSDSHQHAAHPVRELADDAYAGWQLAVRSDLFDNLADALRFSDYEWFESDTFHGGPISPDGDHPLDRITGWRKEADTLFYPLYRLTYPLADHEPAEPPDGSE